jgi:hypothetical protein
MSPASSFRAAWRMAAHPSRAGSHNVPISLNVAYYRQRAGGALITTEAPPQPWHVGRVSHVEAAHDEAADGRFAMAFTFKRRLLCSRLMKSARSPSARNRGFRVGRPTPCARDQRLQPDESPHPANLDFPQGSSAASRSSLRSITPSAARASRASALSSLVQRSAVNSASRLLRILISDRGPSSRVTRSPARARNPVAI